MKRFLTLTFLLAAVAWGQGDFDVNLALDFQSAEQSLLLYQDQFVSTQALAGLRGNILAASTADYIADRSQAAPVLVNYLDSLRYHQIIRDDIFHLEEARAKAPAIRALLEEMKRQNFSRRVAATVSQIFPGDTKISLSIPVYVVALGHENVDAFVQRIVWHGDTPQYVGEGRGELTIVVNLAHAVDYGPDVQSRFLNLLGTVAHEVFHAAFGAYKDGSASWRQFYSRHDSALDQLLDLAQNEGIAYYLSLDQMGRGYLPRGYQTRTREAFAAFLRNAAELGNPQLPRHRAMELLRDANLSGYEGSYGSLTGMFIAREIDTRRGRQALINSLRHSPYEFFDTYRTLSQEDSNLPPLTPLILSQISQKD